MIDLDMLLYDNKMFLIQKIIDIRLDILFKIIFERHVVVNWLMKFYKQ